MTSTLREKAKVSKETQKASPHKSKVGAVTKARITSAKTVKSNLSAAIKGAQLLLRHDNPVYHFTSFEKIQMVKQGISKKALEELKQKAGLDYDQLASILSVGRATLINKKGNDKFNQTLSEKILGLADIYSYGYEVFEDKERFNEWIFRPNRSLGGQMPYDLLDNQYGREEVKNVIGRIDFGVYS